MSPKQHGTTEEGWSEGEDDAELAADEGGGDRKRRRPMSVSCELCKQRKVSLV